jgi:hypothetical protein
MGFPECASCVALANHGDCQCLECEEERGRCAGRQGTQCTLCLAPPPVAEFPDCEWMCPVCVEACALAALML